MVGVVIGIHGDRIVAIDPGPSLDGWSDGRASIEGEFFFDPSGEGASDDAFMDKCLTGFQSPSGMPLRHSGAGACPAGRPVDGLIAVKNGVSGRGCRVHDGAGP